MSSKQAELLGLGILGAGPISQAAHFEASKKARNVELYAVCDAAPDLLERAAAIHQPQVVFSDYATMLADEKVQAVLIAVADQFHVPLAVQALAAGKHVLVEKPMGVSVEECEALCEKVKATNLVVQVGHNRRFDPGVAFAREFVRKELGQMLSYKGWYYDSTYRYTMTDNLQPIPHRSRNARRPEGNPKADRKSYFMLTHGSHMFDLARFIAGEMVSVEARLQERFDALCWFISVEFASGALGHLDLNIPIRGDFEEGFYVSGEFGSVRARLPLSWYHKSSDVECFSTRDGVYRQPLGADAFGYKLQIEGFAETILRGKPQAGANVEDGLATMRAMVAASESVRLNRRVRLSDAKGSV
jgi:predicted dehydrogenase